MTIASSFSTSRTQQPSPSFESRVEILQRIASALLFLHSRLGLCHGDIKPANILLLLNETNDTDTTTTQVVFPYGANVLVNLSTNPTMIAKVGTPGYICPIYQSNEIRRLQPKCDTFSFGIVMAELLTGQLQNHLRPSQRTETGLNFYREFKVRGKPILPHVDPRLAIPTKEVLQRYCDLMLRCMSEELHDRPDDEQVIRCLRDVLDFQPVVPRSASVTTSSGVPLKSCPSPEIVSSNALVAIAASSSLSSPPVPPERRKEAPMPPTVKSQDVAFDKKLSTTLQPLGNEAVYFPPIELHANVSLYLELLLAYGHRFAAADDSDSDGKDQLVHQAVHALHQTHNEFVSKGKAFSSHWVKAEKEVAIEVISNMLKGVCRYDALMRSLDEAEDAYEQSNSRLIEALDEQRGKIQETVGGEQEKQLLSLRTECEEKRCQLHLVESMVDELEADLGAVVSVLKSNQFSLNDEIANIKKRKRG